MELGGAACEGRGKDETGVLRFLIHFHSVGLFRCGPFLLQLCTVMYSSDDDDCDILVQLMLDLARTIIRHLERTDSELTFEDWKESGMACCLLLEIGTFFAFWMELKQIELGHTLDLGTDLLLVVLAGGSLPSISRF